MKPRAPLPSVSARPAADGRRAIFDMNGCRGEMTGGSRRCACGKGLRLAIRWEGGDLTYKCDRFIYDPGDGTSELQIH